MSRPNGPIRHPGMPSTAHSQGDSNVQRGNWDQATAGQRYTQDPYAPHQPTAPHVNDPHQRTQGGSQSLQDFAWPASSYPAQQQPPQYQGWAQQPVSPDSDANPNTSWPAWEAGHHQPRQGYGEAASSTPAAPQYSHPRGPTSPATEPFAASAPAQHGQPAISATTPSAAAAGYDFASYDPPHPHAGFDAPPRHAEQNVNWGHSDPFATIAPDSPAAGPGDFAFSANSPEADPANHLAQVDDFAAEEDDYDYEDQETGGGSRGLLIAVALSGAIVIGGGVAYGYQTLFGSTSTGEPPIVKQASGPAKVKPADPGGRKFAHTDSKIMGRLGSSAGKSNDPAGGARRVSTLRIGRDGSIVPPANPAAAAGGNAPRMVSGLTLGGASAAVAQPEAANAVNASGGDPIVVKPPKADVPPVKVAKVNPVTSESSKLGTKTAAKPPAKVAKPKPKPAKKVAAAKPAAPVATGPKPTGAGYVAVLASVPVSNSSRMDALKQFADMQQKYTSALSNKTPDVQRADLGAKGTYHRLIAGPPGSADSARAVCKSLKEVGHSSCWVLAY